MACERCRKKEVGYELFDYCATCSKSLCPECMAQGCCGKVPAESGTRADYGDDRAAFAITALREAQKAIATLEQEVEDLQRKLQDALRIAESYRRECESWRKARRHGASDQWHRLTH